MLPGRLGGKQLTQELRNLASQIHEEPDAEGEAVTKEAALAALVWKMALGYTEKVRDDDGTSREVRHPPVGWAIQYIYERLEGKATVAQPEDAGGIKASDRVRDLAKQRVQQLAKAAMGPPSHKKKQD